MSNNDLISREALRNKIVKRANCENCRDIANAYCANSCEMHKLIRLIDNAPTVEITETEIQEVLNKRCMTAVANEYLIALHGKWPQGEWEFDSEYTEFGNPYGTYKCSCCGGHSSDKYPYCFWCGARIIPQRYDKQNKNPSNEGRVL